MIFDEEVTFYTFVMWIKERCVSLIIFVSADTGKIHDIVNFYNRAIDFLKKTAVI